MAGMLYCVLVSFFNCSDIQMPRPIKLFLILLAAYFLLYWIAYRNGVDLVKSWHISDYLPTQNLQIRGKDVVYQRAAVPRVIIRDGFNVAFFTKDPWGALWMREPGKVRRMFAAGGSNGSRCLVIRSSSPQDWSYESIILVEVNPGDVFTFHGSAKTTDGAEARMSVVLYDAAKRVVEWNYAIKYVRNGNWAEIDNRFTVPWGGMSYIRLRLTGAGAGNAIFDDIRFVREKPAIK